MSASNVSNKVSGRKRLRRNRIPLSNGISDKTPVTVVVQNTEKTEEATVIVNESDDIDLLIQLPNKRRKLSNPSTAMKSNSKSLSFANVKKTFTESSFSFSRIHQRKMRLISTAKKRLTESNGSLSSVPISIRSDVQERIRSDQEQRSRGYQVNGICGYIERVENQDQYYTRKNYAPKKKKMTGSNEPAYVSMLIVDMTESIRAVESGGTDCKIITDNIGPNVVSGVQIPIMDLVSKSRKCIVVHPPPDGEEDEENLRSIARNCRLLPGMSVRFRIPKRKFTAKEGEFVELSQLYCSRLMNYIIYTKKAQLCQNMFRMNLGRSYQKVISEKLMNLCLLHDWQMLNPPKKAELVPELDRDGDPKYDEDHNPIMRELAPKENYRKFSFMTENFRQCMLPSDKFPMHVNSMSIESAINKKDDDPMMMLRINVETIEASDYQLSQFRKVNIDIVAFGCRPSDTYDDQSLLLAHFGITNPHEFNVLLMNSVMNRVVDEEDEEEEEGGENDEDAMDTSDVNDIFDPYPPMIIQAKANLNRPSISRDGAGGWIVKNDGDQLMDIYDRLSGMPCHSLNMVATLVFPLMAVHFRDRHHGIPLTPEQALTMLLRHNLGYSVKKVIRTVAAEMQKMKNGISLTLQRDSTDKSFVRCYLDGSEPGVRYADDYFNVSDFNGTVNRFFRDANMMIPQPDGPPKRMAQFYLWTASDSYTTEEMHYLLRKDGLNKKIRSIDEVNADKLMGYLMSETGRSNDFRVGANDVCARKLFIVYN